MSLGGLEASSYNCRGTCEYPLTGKLELRRSRRYRLGKFRNLPQSAAICPQSAAICRDLQRTRKGARQRAVTLPSFLGLAFHAMYDRYECLVNQ